MSIDTLEKTDAEFVGRSANQLLREAFLQALASSSRQIFTSTFQAKSGERFLRRSSRFADQTCALEPLDGILDSVYISKAADRLAEFSSYDEDWNGEGASAPLKESIREAGNFLRRLEPWHPRPVASLSSEGFAVIEFYDDENDSFWGSITFLGDENVEIYVSDSILSESNFFEGGLRDKAALMLLSNGLQITLKP